MRGHGPQQLLYCLKDSTKDTACNLLSPKYWKEKKRLCMRLLEVVITTVILQIFSVVLFSIFSVVNGFTEMKKTPKCENTLSDHDSVH